MSKFRLNQKIIDLVLATNPSFPNDGETPKLQNIRVSDSDGTYNVPTVVAHVFIAGSGPIGYALAFFVCFPSHMISPPSRCSFARTLLAKTKKPSVAIADIGSQEGAIKGRNLKNSLKFV